MILNFFIGNLFNFYRVIIDRVWYMSQLASLTICHQAKVKVIEIYFFCFHCFKMNKCYKILGYFYCIVLFSRPLENHHIYDTMILLKHDHKKIATKIIMCKIYIINLKTLSNLSFPVA